MTCFGIENNQLEMLAILNSTLVKEYLQMVCVKARGGYLRLKSQYITGIPVPENITNNNLSAKADIMLEKNKELNQLSEQFTKLLQTKFLAININNKIQRWYSLTANEFLKRAYKTKNKTSAF